MPFLTIIADTETFEYSPIDPVTHEKTDTVFVCRILSDAEIKTIRKPHHKREFDKASHQMTDRLDDVEFLFALVDAAIVDWRGLRNERDGKELPCSTAMKRFLPADVRAEVVRICAAKEAGGLITKAEEEKKPSKPTSTLSKVS